MIPILAAIILTAIVQPVSALDLPGTLAPDMAIASSLLQKLPILLGTTGDCNNVEQGGPCTEKSTLVQLDSRTGALIRTIGPVGYTVNGLAWDRTSGNLYATTAAGDITFHGLIKINPLTGRGIPVNKKVVNFGLEGTRSPVHSITVDVFGHMVGWYDEFGPGVTEDTYVRIDQKTGAATEFAETGINTSRNGLSFGEFNLLWNIDTPRLVGETLSQTAYLLNPFDGNKLASISLEPPTSAALGDFHPQNNLYYGLNFEPLSPTTFIVVIDVLEGTATTLGQTVDGLHTLAFIP
jgi:hypothetical protein